MRLLTGSAVSRERASWAACGKPMRIFAAQTVSFPPPSRSSIAAPSGLRQRELKDHAGYAVCNGYRYRSGQDTGFRGPAFGAAAKRIALPGSETRGIRLRAYG